MKIGRSLFITALLVFSALFISAAFASVDVFIDGNLQKYDVPAEKIKGRVMVPLRGVFEALGAKVKYDAVTRKITAEKGDDTVMLYLGSREAFINSERQMLDVPAGTLGGRTMVPLRFVSEALGAKVKWDGETQSVLITTAGEEKPSEDKGPAIDSIKIYPAGRVKPGDTIRINAEGDRGAEATFEIKGVTKERPLKEDKPGKYSARYKIPRKASFESRKILVTFKKDDLKTEMESKEAIWTKKVVSTRIVSEFPKDDSVITKRRPKIGIELEHSKDAGIHRNYVRFILDGKDITGHSKVTVSDDEIYYIPPKDLKYGRHEVSISGKDSEGTSFKKEWDFQISKTSSSETGIDPLTYLAYEGATSLLSGQDLKIVARGTPGLTGTFDVGTLARGIPMKEVSPGYYEGIYRVRSTDRLSDAPVKVSFNDGSRSYSKVMPSRINLGRTGSGTTRVTSVIPSSNSRIKNRRPRIEMTLSHTNNAEVDADRLEFRVNGARVNDRVVVERYRIHYTPDNDLPYGINFIRVSGYNTYGNRFIQNWDFTVERSSGTTSIKSLHPDSGQEIQIRRPLIRVDFNHTSGAKLDRNKVRLRINGTEYSDVLSVSDNRVSYRPDFDLPIGTNNLTITAENDNGQSISRSWSFTVKESSSGESITGSHNGSPLLKAGDTFTVNAVGPPGGVMTFNVGDQLSGVRMREYSKGRYRGTYRVKTTDNAKNVPVTLNYHLLGKNINYTLPGTATFVGSSYPTPTPTSGGSLTISSPSRGAMVAGTFPVSGTAPADSDIEVTIVHAQTGHNRGTYKTRADASGAFSVQCNIKSIQMGGQYRINVRAIKNRRVYTTDPIPVRTRMFP